MGLAPAKLLSMHSVLRSLHDSDLLLGQPIQLIHQRVDLRVGGLDLALVELLVGGDGQDCVPVGVVSKPEALPAARHQPLVLRQAGAQKWGLRLNESAVGPQAQHLNVGPPGQVRSDGSIS